MPQGRRGRSGLATATLMTRADLPRLAACARRFLSCSSVSRSSASVPLIEAADYLCSRFILHLVEGGHQLVARIVVMIAGRFRRAPLAKVTVGGEDRHEDIAAGKVRRYRHDRRGAGDRQDLAG
jgi:hypothetical protein